MAGFVYRQLPIVAVSPPLKLPVAGGCPCWAPAVAEAGTKLPLGGPSRANKGAAPSVAIFVAAAVLVRRGQRRLERKAAPRSDAEMAAPSAAATDATDTCSDCGAPTSAARWEAVRREALAAWLVAYSGSKKAGAETIQKDSVILVEGDVCIDCKGDRVNVCFRCGGTKKMKMLKTLAENAAVAETMSDCTECDDGYKVCGRCFGTGLSPAALKKGAYFKDPAFKKVAANAIQRKMDEEGRALLAQEMPEAIREHNARWAAKKAAKKTA